MSLSVQDSGGSESVDTAKLPMRADMAQVIVERPRINSRAPSRKKGYRKYLARTGAENLPRREPMLGHWRGKGKYLNEHLGPMQRFLRSRIGRPWNKVHQELCEHITFDNAVQKHVLTHIFQFVERLVEIDDRGFVFCAEGWQRGRMLRVGDMYVCPKTGLLRELRARKKSLPPRRLGLGRLTQYHQRDGVWWELKLQPLAAEPGAAWDAWLDAPAAKFGDRQLREAYGGRLRAISIRPLTRREAQVARREAHSGRRR